MTRTNTPKVPTYRFHKGSRQAAATFDGRDFYFGEYRSAESHVRYRR